MSVAKQKDTSVAATDSPPVLTKSGRTRLRLIRSSRDIFLRDGFANTRISDISAAASVSHGTFYTYFDSKYEIFLELVRDAVQRIAATMEDIWSISLPPERALHAVMEAWVVAYAAEAPLLALIEGVGPQATDLIKLREEVLAQQINQSIEVVRRYQKAGVASSSLDPEYVATALGLMVQSFSRRLAMSPQDFELAKVVETLAEVWRGAIGLSRPGGD
jgi:AcrR family transcriptional regulator